MTTGHVALLLFCALSRATFCTSAPVEGGEITSTTALPQESTTVIDAEPITVCYGELGCFDSNGGPVSGRVKYLPEDPEKTPTKFALFTPGDRIEGVQLSLDNLTTLNAISPDLPIAFVIHGFGRESYPITNMKKAVLEVVPQVVVVDWSRGARLPYYLNAVTNTQIVGRQIAYLVENLRLHRNVSPERVHLIGFSLGAHVSGFAGKWLKSRYNQTIGRISALDAASPYFEETRFHVTSEDATYLDAIHTNTDNQVPGATSMRVGSKTPYGHVDFYPNGGHTQAHCKRRFWDVYCSHYAAVEYFRASIASRHECSFLSTRCLSVEEAVNGNCETGEVSSMGYFSTKYSSHGIHYLKTHDEEPYC